MYTTIYKVYFCILCFIYKLLFMTIDIKIYWIAQIWQKRQVVIPKNIRDIIWLHSWDEVMFLLRDWKFIWIIKHNDLDNIINYAKSECINII